MRIQAIVFAALVLAWSALGFLGRNALESRLTSPLDPTGESRLVSIPAGIDAPQLIEHLQAEGLVADSKLLELYARYLHRSGRLTPGEYRLAAGLTPVQLIERIERGLVHEHTVTLPAGATVESLAAELARAGLVEEEAFIQAAHDPALAQRLGIEGPSVEGFIFPDVWALPRGLGPRPLIERLVKRFFDEVPNLGTAAQRLGLTPYQLVTVASLVERGPIPSEERRLYAALLVERLQKGYALESMAADEYGRRRPGAPANPREDPWNTTERPGLPRTPIGSPSLSSLRAAAEPVDTEPVFMVRRGAGRHVFCPDIPCYLRALEAFAPGQRPHLPLHFEPGAAPER